MITTAQLRQSAGALETVVSILGEQVKASTTAWVDAGPEEQRRFAANLRDQLSTAYHESLGARDDMYAEIQRRQEQGR